MLNGQCNCGAVSFEIAMEPTDIYICHCSICRKWSGTNGIAVTIVPNDRFRWISGQDRVASWQKPGADWQSWFCRDCGSALPGHNDDQAMFVPAGLLPGETGKLKVAHHIWVDSSAEWDQIGDHGKQHPKGFQA